MALPPFPPTVHWPSPPPPLPPFQASERQQQDNRVLQSWLTHADIPFDAFYEMLSESELLGELPFEDFQEVLEKSNFSEEQKQELRGLRLKKSNRIAAKKSREGHRQGLEELKRLRDSKELELANLRKEREELEMHTANLDAALKLACEKRKQQLAEQERDPAAVASSGQEPVSAAPEQISATAVACHKSGVSVTSGRSEKTAHGTSGRRESHVAKRALKVIGKFFAVMGKKCTCCVRGC